MRIYRFDKLDFRADDGRLSGPEGTKNLRPQVATLLQTLLERPREVHPRQELFDAVWGEDAVVDFESGLAALLRELRQAIEAVGGRGQLIETVPRRGYRLAGEVNVDEGRPGGGALPPRPRRWPTLAALAIVPLALAAVLLYWARPAADPAADYRLAILPLERFGEVPDAPDHAGLLLADSLLAELLQRPAEGLDLIGRTSLRPYVTREDVAAAIARDLGVELLVEGSVSAAGDGPWQVELRLLAVPAGTILWSESIRGDAGEALEPRAVAAQLAQRLISAWPGLRDRLGEGY